MIRFHVGDIVKVRVVPHGCMSGWANMLGQVGIIDEISNKHTNALVQGITIAGRAGGYAYIAVRALERVDDPAWTAAAIEYRRWDAEWTAQFKKWEQQRLRRLEELAERYHLSLEQLVEIADALDAPVPRFEMKEKP